MDKELSEIYYNPAKVGSYGGIKSLSRATNNKNVKEWLTSQETYTLHKPIRRKFPRRKMICVGLDHIWQIDLADMNSLSGDNDGFRYLLTCIDCYSRFAWVVPIKNKSASTVTTAFATMLRDRKPMYVQSDKGSEFVNSTFQSFLKSNDIHFYTSENDDIKCALVERFNRTLKSKMWRYFTYTGKARYVDVLPALLQSYNDTKHSAINIAPSDVTLHNPLTPRKRVVSSRLKHRLQIGDYVRISETKRAFKKGYVGSWTRELFKIVQRHNTHPETYSLCDYSDEPIKGKFYKQELQKVVGDTVFKVDKVLKTRKKHGKTQYFVHWLGYPAKFDSWVDNLI